MERAHFFEVQSDRITVWQRNKLTTVQKERKYPLRIGEWEKTGIALFYGHRTSTIEDWSCLSKWRKKEVCRIKAGHNGLVFSQNYMSFHKILWVRRPQNLKKPPTFFWNYLVPSRKSGRFNFFQIFVIFSEYLNFNNMKFKKMSKKAATNNMNAPSKKNFPNCPSCFCSLCQNKLLT